MKQYYRTGGISRMSHLPLEAKTPNHAKVIAICSWLFPLLVFGLFALCFIAVSTGHRWENPTQAQVLDVVFIILCLAGPIFTVFAWFQYKEHGREIYPHVADGFIINTILVLVVCFLLFFGWLYGSFVSVGN